MSVPKCWHKHPNTDTLANGKHYYLFMLHVKCIYIKIGSADVELLRIQNVSELKPIDELFPGS